MNEKSGVFTKHISLLVQQLLPIIREIFQLFLLFRFFTLFCFFVFCFEPVGWLVRSNAQIIIFVFKNMNNQKHESDYTFMIDLTDKTR